MRGMNQGNPEATAKPDTSEQIYISSLALLKMLKHARAGVPLEVMGLLIGEVIDDYAIKVVDVFAMPQSGTSVSVESVDPVYQQDMLDMHGMWRSDVNPFYVRVGANLLRQLAGHAVQGFLKGQTGRGARVMSCDETYARIGCPGRQHQREGAAHANHAETDGMGHASSVKWSERARETQGMIHCARSSGRRTWSR